MELNRAFPVRGLVVFDALHRYSRWRNFLKGLYDTHGQALYILVTGKRPARLLSTRGRLVAGTLPSPAPLSPVPEGREVDVVQMKAGRPTRFVECKVADAAISPALLYLRRKFPTVEAVQVLDTRGIDRIGRDRVRLVSADRFLTELVV